METKTPILVVENDSFIALDLENILMAAGYRVFGAVSSYDDAVRLAASTSAPVAIVDYRLDGANAGVRLAKHLRTLGTKIIYVTGSEAEVRRADPGAEVIAKPFEPGDLLEAIDRLLSV